MEAGLDGTEESIVSEGRGFRFGSSSGQDSVVNGSYSVEKT